MAMTCREFNDLVESYLADALSEIKREAVEEHYFQCDGCFTALKIRERLFSGEVPIRLTTPKPSRVWALKHLFKPVLALASLLIVVVSTLWVVGNYRRGKFLENISEVETPVYIRTETRGDSQAQQNRTFDRAMTLYNNGQYHEALELLNSLEAPAGTELNPQVLFFTALCLLESGDPGAAVRHFDRIIEERNPSYHDDAVFYKGIALLRLNEKAQALEQFMNLAALPGPYSSRAKALMEKIEKK